MDEVVVEAVAEAGSNKAFVVMVCDTRVMRVMSRFDAVCWIV